MEGTLTENQPINPWGTKSNTSPWSKPNNTVTPCSLEDVMSEQLAGELQEKETCSSASQPLGIDIEPELQELINATNSETDTSSDVALARQLQIQYDQEHNQLLQAQEKQFNGTNKVTLSFDNYKCQYPEFDEDDDDDYDQDDGYEEKSPWDKEAVPHFNAQGYSGKGKNITTKHDSIICGRKNASKMINFPPEFVCGDGEGMDMKLPNNVYNKLKRHSEAENKRNQKIHEKKEHSTAEHAMDPRTRLSLYKMVNNGTLESISGTVCTGKESVILHALGGTFKHSAQNYVKVHTLPPEVAIKVFKTTLNEFKTREKYVHGDHRFSKDDYKKQNPRKIIMMWAMKEAANLNSYFVYKLEAEFRFLPSNGVFHLWDSPKVLKMHHSADRMKKFNIPCPEVYVLKKHVLVMTFIGVDQKPAPKLKDANMSYTDYCDAYEQTIQIMKKIQRDCGLVHADLSEYNILWWKGRVWIIDVSQAVDVTHPSAMEFLYRDCTNVINFFKSKNATDSTHTPEWLFNEVTGLNIQGAGAEFVSQVQRYNKEKDEELLANQSSTRTYQFDYFWEKSMAEKFPDQLHVSDSDSDNENTVDESVEDKSEDLNELKE